MVEIGDDEILYRRLPARDDYYVNGILSLQAFKPNRKDVTGISLTQANARTPEEEALAGENPAGYYIVLVPTALIRAVGLSVVHNPTPDNSGHCEVPELCYSSVNTTHSREARRALAKLCSDECVVLGPYKSRTSDFDN